MKRPGRFIAVALFIGGLMFAMGPAAWAADGPTPPKPGDPVGADVSPHGGYSSTTNMCLQCHTAHNAGEYALMWKASVTDTCATCHGYLGAAATGTRDPVGPGTLGTTSLRTVYNNTAPAAAHGIGASSPPAPDSGITITEGGWSYSWRYGTKPGSGAASSTTPAGAGTAAAGTGGLYCGSCHAPHGDYGYAINTKWANSTDATGTGAQTKKDWTEGSQIWWKDPSTSPGTWRYYYLHLDADPAVWELCSATSPAPVAGAADTGCSYAQVKDSEGQLVSFYGYKMLSAFPNHQYGANPASWGTDKYDHDQASWCGTCHPSKVDTMFGGTQHNHPTGCTACHGNPTSDATSRDFPHTSSFGKFMIDYPDALCVSCHTTGN